MVKNWSQFSFLIYVVVGSLLFFSGCEPDNRNDERQAPIKYQGKIIALGDSLTAGLGVALESSYPTLLQQKLEKEGFSYRVVNAGVSGETSSGALSRLNWILSQKPDIVILETGANDGLRGISMALVEKNLSEILTILREKRVVTVFTGMQMVKNLGDDYSSTFNRVYQQLAAQPGVIFMPFFLKDVAGEPSLNNADGIHPNEDGYKRIVENLYPYVVKAIEVSQAQQ